MAFDWLKKKVDEAKQEIEEKVSDKIFEENMDPTAREHKGQPPGAPKRKDG
jgi:hypothetical protein